MCRELEEQSMAEVKGIIDINLTGTFQLIKAALPGMKGGGDGRPRSIALISSMAGQVGVYGFMAYFATKFVLRGLADALQQEVVTDNIHVSLIFPPSVETPSFMEVNKTRSELSIVLRQCPIEAINGALAMIGLTTGLVIKGQTRQTILEQLLAIVPLAVVHTLGNLLTIVSLGKVAVSFTHTIKAMEPFFSVVLSTMFIGEGLNVKEIYVRSLLFGICCHAYQHAGHS